MNLERFHNQLALNLGYKRIINNKEIIFSVEESYSPMVTLQVMDTSEVIRFKASDATKESSVKVNSLLQDEIKTIMKAVYQAYIAANTKF